MVEVENRPNYVVDLVEEFEDRLCHAGNNAMDIANICAMGLRLDDNNNPAPESIPGTNDATIPNNQQ